MQGEIDFFDLCESDRMSLIKLRTMTEMLGQKHGSIKFYWKFSSSVLGFDFRLIKNEADVLEMYKNVLANRYISIYISTNGVVIDENIIGLVNEVDVDDNAVLEKVVTDIEVNENENRPTSLDIVVFRGNSDKQLGEKDLGDVESDKSGYDTYGENDSDSSFR